MRLVELLGAEVQTESGEALDRVFDVRCEEVEGGLELVGVVVGPHGFLERLGLLSWRGMRKHGEQTRPHVEAIPWEDVLRIDEGILIVRDGARPREL